MMPIDPPGELATQEDIVRWLREFTEHYNRLLDDLSAARREDVNNQNA